MKHWLKRIAIGLAGLFLVLIALACFGAYAMYAPTQGPKIESYPDPKKALLVIDVQEDYTGGSTPLFADHEKLISATNRVLDASPRLGLLPIYIRQEVPDNALGRLLSGGRAIQGQPGTRTDVRVHRIEGAPDFSKERSDAFSNPALDAWLRAQCVFRTIAVGDSGPSRSPVPKHRDH